MPQKNRIELKTLFQNGNYPTDDDFGDVIDSSFNKADDTSITLSGNVAANNVTASGSVSASGSISANNVAVNNTVVAKYFWSANQTGISAIDGDLLANGFTIGTFGHGRLRMGDLTDPDFSDNGTDIFQTNGSIMTRGFAANIRIVYDNSVPYQIDFDDHTVLFGHPSGQYAFTPPPASHGKLIYVRIFNGSTGVTIQGNGANINGTSNVTITDPGYTYIFQYDSVTNDWIFIGKLDATI